MSAHNLMTLRFAEVSKGSSASHGGWGGSLSLVIYEKPQSICVINFVNERQNDVVLGSFNVSQHNVFHGTGSESGTSFFAVSLFFGVFLGGGTVSLRQM